MEEGERAPRRPRWHTGARLPVLVWALAGCLLYFSVVSVSRFPGLQQLKGLKSHVLVPFGKGRVHFLKEARNPILLGLFDGLFGLSQFQPLRPDVRLLSYVGG